MSFYSWKAWEISRNYQLMFISSRLGLWFIFWSSKRPPHVLTQMAPIFYEHLSSVSEAADRWSWPWNLWLMACADFHTSMSRVLIHRISGVMTQSSALELFHFCFQVELVFFFLYMEQGVGFWCDNKCYSLKTTCVFHPKPFCTLDIYMMFFFE